MEFLGREGYRRGGWVKGETFDGEQKIKENQVMRKKKKKKGGSLNREGENDPGMSLPRQTLSQRWGVRKKWPPALRARTPFNLRGPTLKRTPQAEPRAAMRIGEREGGGWSPSSWERKGEDIWVVVMWPQGFPGGSRVKNLPANAEDMSLIPGLGRSPGEGNGNPLQYSCLGNPMDRGAWQATVHGATKESDMTQQLNDRDKVAIAVQG